MTQKSNTQERIEERLRVLIGLPLREAGRSVDRQWFSLGRPMVVPDPRAMHRADATGTDVGDVTMEVGEYEIQVECPWRLRGPVGIITGSRDYYEPARTESGAWPVDFDWRISGATRADERVAALFLERGGELRVEFVRADRAGGLVLQLSSGYGLDVFPEDTVSREYWRMFRYGARERHLVVTPEGIRG